jgi:hypothetical protein
MIDTGPANAWITRVAGADPSDRLNFLSAALCVSAARRLLGRNRTPASAGDDPQVLIIAPYHAHAALLNLLIRQARLENDVHAGTPETLHDARAPAVILDLVEDAPFPGTPMFRPKADPTTAGRLANAVDRARRRLVVAGNFDPIERRARGAVAGSCFVPALRERAAMVEAADLQRPPEDGSPRQPFVEALAGKIDAATDRVLIYSPTLDMDRLQSLKDSMLMAAQRRARIYIVTRPVVERRKSEADAYQGMEGMLAEWKVTVIYQLRVHEKLVFIDDRAIWFGSRDPLGPCDPGGGGWHDGRPLIDFAARQLRCGDLVAAHVDGHRPRCPICGGDIVAAVGRHLPFYWRCIEKGCYTRAIDTPPAAAAQESLRCARCDSEVAFGKWGGKPYWRCLANRRHRQPIAMTHLTTPETAERIPAWERARLMKAFGIPKASS